MNSALGPTKEVCVFIRPVCASIIKFLAFEQVFKTHLQVCRWAAARAARISSPRGNLDNEVMRFCNRFMTELFRHVGPHTDVPAGDNWRGQT